MRKPAFVVLAFLAACAPTPPPAAPNPANNPCRDAQYIALKEKEVEQMSDREYQLFLQRDQACTQYQQMVVQMEPAREMARQTENLTSWLIAIPILGAVIGAFIYQASF
jgi:hypothetical protein